MQIPTASEIEAAGQQLEQITPELANMIGRQQKELMTARGEVSIEFSHGFMVGLQTARLCLQTHAGLRSALESLDLKPEDLL